MKSPGFLRLKVLLAVLLGMGMASVRVFAADLEIDLGDEVKPTPTVAPKITVSVKPMPSPTAAPASKTTSIPSKATPSPTLESKGKVTPVASKTPEIVEVPTFTPTAVAVVETSPTPIVIQGKLKMKDIYAAGIRAYQEQDYDTAIHYLEKALSMEDPYSQKFYYAEAAAMLGVIYQFHVIHNEKALHYYQLALQHEKKNATARRHIKEVQKLVKEGE